MKIEDMVGQVYWAVTQDEVEVTFHDLNGGRVVFCHLQD